MRSALTPLPGVTEIKELNVGKRTAVITIDSEKFDLLKTIAALDEAGYSKSELIANQ